MFKKQLTQMYRIFINPFRPEFTIVIFIHSKQRIAVTIFDLLWMKMIEFGLKIKENCHVLVTQFHDIFILKPLVFGKISLFSGMSNDALMHREGLNG